MPVSSFDFKNAEGKTDWKAYDAAREAERANERTNGRRCYQCGSLNFHPRGYPQLCGVCEHLHDTGEVNHHSRIRCPKCQKIEEVENLFEEGSHEVTCRGCDHKFTVETCVSYTFTSPPLLESDGLENSEGASAPPAEGIDPNDGFTGAKKD